MQEWFAENPSAKSFIF